MENMCSGCDDYGHGYNNGVKFVEAKIKLLQEEVDKWWSYNTGLTISTERREELKQIFSKYI